MKKLFLYFSVVAGIIFNTFLGFSNYVFADDSGNLAGSVGKFEDLYIRAVSPGFDEKVDGVKVNSNVGELIEIARKNADAPISLAGLAVSYTNSSGNTVPLYEFPKNFIMTGENLTLRLANTSYPFSSPAILTYKTQLALGAGPLALVVGADFSKTKEAEVLATATIYDSVCWTGKEGCFKKFSSEDFEVLYRESFDAEWGRISLEEYVSRTKVDESGWYLESLDYGGGGGDDGGAGMGGLEAQCLGLQFSEILSYYAEAKEEQFIEIHNTNPEQILLDGCKVKYKNKSYALSGVLKADAFLAIYPSALGFNLTKNPTNSNVLEILDVSGAAVDTLEYFNGQKKGTSYALVGYDGAGEEIWKTTYAATPGEANVYQEFRTCAEGKVINETTGNCVKVTTVEEKVCAAGQYLNLLTNRCKKYEEAKVTTCKEGYYLYEETGRCRKIVTNSGANYAVTPEEYEEEKSFVALFAVLGILILGVLYVVYEFRDKIFGKVFRGVRQKRRRGVGRHLRKRGGRGTDNAE